MKNRGIDISHYQTSTKIDFVKAYNDLVITHDEDGNLLPEPIRPFVICKAAQGIDYKDATFIQNIEAAKAAGFIVLAYFFFDPTKDPIAQAQNFLSTLQASFFPLGVALDIEQYPGWDGLTVEAIAEMIQSWLDYVQEQLGGKPIVYTDIAFIKQYLTAFPMGNYMLWLAHDGTAVPAGFTNYTLLQFSANGQIDGITGPVDLDEFDGQDISSLLIPAKA